MSPSQPNSTTPTPKLAGREIIVAVCGGIAAYKSADLVSKLVQQGAGVTVCMTAAAKAFVTPLTFQTLSARRVHDDIFDPHEPADTQHIALTEKAELMVVAPATANMMAKVACGVCDDLVSLMISAAACPVVFAPAMNNRMWAHPVTQRNVSLLNELGYFFIGPDEGWLACRNVGAGRMSNPPTIVDEVVRMMTQTGAMPPVIGAPRDQHPAAQ